MKTIIVGITCLVLGLAVGLIAPNLIGNKKPSEETVEQEKTANSEDSSYSSKNLARLRDKKGSQFDKEYLNLLIANSQYSIDIANLAEGRTEREEVKKWSKFLIETEPNSINALKTLYGQWGYRTEDINSNPDKH